MYIYNGILFSYEEAQVSFSGKWKHLEIIVLNKLNQTQRKYHDLSHLQICRLYVHIQNHVCMYDMETSEIV